MALEARHPQQAMPEQMLNFSDAARWKVWLEAPGSITLQRGLGSPWVRAAHIDSATVCTSWGSVKMICCGEGLSTEEKVAGG